jgi:hypothetical protein
MAALEAYLADFEAHAHRLPRETRYEVRARIWTHCAAAAGPGAPEERVRAALAELGPADALVRDELARAGVPADPFRPRDLAPLHLLGASFLTLGAGTVAGLVLLWRSAAWPRRHKAVATALVAIGAGLGAAVPVAVAPAPPWWAGALAGAVLIGPALAAVHLFVASKGLRSAQRI